MSVLKKIFQKFPLFLALVVLVSYGQMLWMQPWQDDNALFFKLANLEDRAGYLGAGPLGDGAYKYTAAFYIPIHFLFGFNTVAYFAYTLLLYYLATLAVYKMAGNILGERAGKLSSFLFAAGYIAADGFIRLYNSPATSLSIIFISLFLLGYWKFYQEKKGKWWALALLSFFLATEFMRYRTHYLIILPIAFELTFLTFVERNRIISLVKSILRVVPFGYIFFRYFIFNADSRTGDVKNWVLAILGGSFFKTFSFFTSVANIILPDWLTGILFNSHITFWLSVLGLVFVVVSLAVVLSLKLYKKTKLFFLVPLLIFIWLVAAKCAYSSPLLMISESQKMVAFLGGVILILALAISPYLKGDKLKLYFFLGVWFLANIASYASYQPTVAYESANRFFAHSFFAFVFTLGLLSLENKKVLYLGLVWGIGNLFFSSVSLNHLLYARSFPVKNFYSQIKTYVPTLGKGDVIYFDVADNANNYYANAFSVAQMPEETALAWRYGLDRYDIRMVTDFEELKKTLGKKEITDINDQPIPINNYYSFFYSKDGVINTTGQVRRFFDNEISKIQPVNFSTLGNTKETIINFSKQIDSATPVLVRFTGRAIPLVPDDAVVSGDASYWSLDKSKLALDYGKEKESLLKNAKVETTSDWRENISSFLLDQNLNTYWQSDRVLFSTEKKAGLTIDLGKIERVNKLVWVNAFGNNSPIEYSIQTSSDNKVWKTVKNINSITRINTRELQVVDFAPADARFIRMVIEKTISGDSPTISEVWVVPIRYSSLDIIKTEEFLKTPLAYASTSREYETILNLLGYRGENLVYWQADKTGKWASGGDSRLTINYDGKEHAYSFIVPAGGTRLGALKFSDSQIPGEINIGQVEVRNLNINELR